MPLNNKARHSTPGRGTDHQNCMNFRINETGRKRVPGSVSDATTA